MITGFNTDIDFNGRVYHVQTEDRGLKHPIVESLVYTGGEIITSRKTSYSDVLESGAFSEDYLLQRMETQHRNLIREIRNGKFETEQLKPFGHSIVTNRSFDEVVLSFLADNCPVEEIKLRTTGPAGFQEGTRSSLVFEVVEGLAERPVRDATVVVRLVATGQQPRELFASTTDKTGRVEAAFDIPVLRDANSAIVCRADAHGRTAELKKLVRKSEVEASAKHP